MEAGRNEDDNARIEPSPARAYQRRQPRNVAAIFIVMTLLALLALGGIIYALMLPSEDPDTIKLPEHTTKSLAEEQPLSGGPSPETPPPAPETLQPDAAASPALVTPPAAPVAPPAAPPAASAPLPKPQSAITPPPETSPPVAAAPVRNGGGLIALVIDDMGVDLQRSQAMAQMPPAVTFAYLPYAPYLAAQADAAYKNGHELIVHMPMEPDDAKRNDPGPDALLTSLPAADNAARMQRNLGRFDHYMGINNHMGSRMTADENAMRPIIATLKERQLWFLDSRTIGNSVAARLADEAGVPFAQRDVFLDNVETVPAVLEQLHQLEQIADKRGYAVAIGHPRTATISALKQWLPGMQQRRLKLVPLSTIIALRFPQAPLPRFAQTARPELIAVSQRN